MDKKKVKCPSCKSKNISAEFDEITGHNVAICLDCDYTWVIDKTKKYKWVNK